MKKLTTDNLPSFAQGYGRAKQPTTMNRKAFWVLLLVVSFSLLVVANTASAQDLNLIVCDNSPRSTLPDCTFEHLMQLVRNLINALIIFSTFLATAAFAYAGIILLSSGGDEGAKKRAKDIFLKVLKGYLWILAAWLLVYTITSTLLNDDFSLLDGPGV